MAKLTVKDVELKGKKVLVRVDFNVPQDENKKVYSKIIEFIKYESEMIVGLITSVIYHSLM